MKKLLAVTLLVSLIGTPLLRADNNRDRKAKKTQQKLAQNQSQNNVHRQPVKPAVQPTHSNVTAKTYNRNKITTKNNFNNNNSPYAKRNKKGDLVVKNKPNNVVINNNKYNKVTVKNRNFNYRPDRVSFVDARNRFRWDRHDRGWYRSRYNRIVFYGGGYWFWNSGWWYPAYGYNPYYTSYIYDGPIYGYGYANPGDITVRVQQRLSQIGYYRGPVDGVIGYQTRQAIERYQIDNGLNATAAIDEPTLATLGLT